LASTTLKNNPKTTRKCDATANNKGQGPQSTGNTEAHHKI